MSPITRDHPSLRLILLPNTFYVQQVQKIPPDLLRKLTQPSQGFLSITQTAEEISIVGECFGPLGGSCSDFESGPGVVERLTGILADLSTPLKRAGVPIFAVSTWNTDYLLVPKEKVSTAIDALVNEGWLFQSVSGAA